MTFCVETSLAEHVLYSKDYLAKCIREDKTGVLNQGYIKNGAEMLLLKHFFRFLMPPTPQTDIHSLGRDTAWESKGTSQIENQEKGIFLSFFLRKGETCIR